MSPASPEDSAAHHQASAERLRPPHGPFPQASSDRAEAARRAAALSAFGPSRSAVRYRGFVLLPQSDQGWLVRPERSPMTVLPFRTPAISLSDVKALVDGRLDGEGLSPGRGEHRAAS